ENADDWGPVSVRVADVDGDGMNELVIYVLNSNEFTLTATTSGKVVQTINDQNRELIYKYDKASSTLTRLTSDPASYTQDATHTYGRGPSAWVKARKSDTRYTRIRLNSYSGKIEAAQFVNGAWNSVSAGARPADLAQIACPHTGGDCVGYTDLNGDGNAD